MKRSRKFISVPLVDIRSASMVLMFVLCALTSCTTAPVTGNRTAPIVGARGEIIVPFEKPGSIRDDYVNPENLTRQIFTWGSFGFEWCVIPSFARATYAGFVMRRPIDFSKTWTTTCLKFRLKPSSMREHLSIALIDGNRRGPLVMSHTELSRHWVNDWKEWGLFVIPLKDFPHKGYVLSGEKSTQKRQSLDRSDILGIRLTVAAEHPCREPIFMRNLQFTPSPRGL